MSFWKPSYWRYIAGSLSLTCVCLILAVSVITSFLPAAKKAPPNIQKESAGDANKAELEKPKESAKQRKKKPLESTDQTPSR